MPIVHHRLPVRSPRLRAASSARSCCVGPAPGPGRRRRGNDGRGAGEPGRPADGPVRGGARPRRRPHRLHAGRAGHGPVQATRRGPLDRRWRRRRSSCPPAASPGSAMRAAPTADADPTGDAVASLGVRRRPPGGRPVGPDRCRHRELGRHRRRAHLRPRRGRRSRRPPPRGLRLPAVLGAGRQLDPARLGEALDRRLLRRRRGRERATSRSADATGPRRSAGAAGPARR